MFCVNSDGARRAVDVSGGAGYSPYQAFRASASASFTATSSFDPAGKLPGSGREKQTELDQRTESSGRHLGPGLAYRPVFRKMMIATSKRMDATYFRMKQRPWRS